MQSVQSFIGGNHSAASLTFRVECARSAKERMDSRIDVSGVTVQIMSPAEWSEIPDNPIQRDTERHAKKAMNRHLRFELLTQICVHMARFPDGRGYKIDGHTRSHLWQQGLLTAPESLLVVVWPVENMEQLKSFYLSFDEQSAAEDLKDKLSGILRHKKIEFESSFLKKLSFKSSVQAAHSFVYGVGAAENASLETLIETWLPELRMIDRLNPKGKDFPAGVLFGALLCFARDGDDAEDFWSRYALDQGIKIGKDKEDAVFRLKHFVMSGKTAKRYGGSVLVQTGIYALSAYTANGRGNASLYQSFRNLNEERLIQWATDVRIAKDAQHRERDALIRRSAIRKVA